MLQNLSLRSLALSFPARLAAVIVLVLLATLSLSAVLSQWAHAEPVLTGDGGGGLVDADPGGGSSVTFLPVDVAGGVCTAPDNGLGTADLPAELCKYIAPTELMMIIDGLPPGTTIEITPTLSSYTNISVTAGGTLGGQIHQFDAILTMEMEGTGSFAGFTRRIQMQVEVEIHTGPRTPGDPVQIFPADLFHMQGQVFGDPDFDQLVITAGTGNGLPSPGHVAITELPSGDYAIDSFFDITYRIDFQGAPGGMLDGLSGSTTASIRMESARYMCTGPDNGGGSPDLPPAPCSYEPLGDRMEISDGLPPASTIEVMPILHGYTNISATAGGTLGGDAHTFSATLELIMGGTGDLAGFGRTMNMTVSVEMHTGPYAMGGPIRIVRADLFSLEGVISGDPDFEVLTVTVGTDHGLPSSGEITLVDLPSGDFAIDSFFDISYKIDFDGAPGSPLEGRRGSTTGPSRVRMRATTPLATCYAPDDGFGTVPLPTKPCEYVPRRDRMRIVAGLAPTSTIVIDPKLYRYSSISIIDGGPFGGQAHSFGAIMLLRMSGTGGLSGFGRLIPVPVEVVMHTGPRHVSSLTRTFPAEIYSLVGSIFSDPDFDSLSITAGAGEGLPSPGRTTLTKLPSGDFAVDSFFDITYRIDFVGASGSVLHGKSGTTTGEPSVRLEEDPSDPDLGIFKLVFPPFAGPGERISYTIVFSNTGGSTGTGVSIVDAIPVSVTNISVISSGAPIFQVAPAYVWGIQYLPPRQVGMITVTGFLSDSLLAGQSFRNTVSIACAEPEISTGNNSDFVVVAVHDKLYLPLVLRNY